MGLTSRRTKKRGRSEITTDTIPPRVRATCSPDAPVAAPPQQAGHDRAVSGGAFLALALAGCIWGTTFLFGKIALAEMGVGHMVLYRFLFACIGLFPVALRQHLTYGFAMPPRSDTLLFMVAAALYVPVQFLVQYEGLALTTVAHASLMMGIFPVLIAMGAALFTHERLGRTGWVALVASTLGAALIVVHAGSNADHAAGGAGGASLLGDLLVLASTLAGVAWILVTKRLMRRRPGYPPVVASIYVLVPGTVMLAAWVLAVDGPPPIHISVRAWLALAEQGVLATAATTLLWNWGLERVPSSRAGIFINLEPVIGAILGVMVLHETLGPLAIVGGALIVGAAVVFTRTGSS